MSELRRRKAGPRKDKNRPSAPHANDSSKGQLKSERKPEQGVWYTCVNYIFGATVAVIVGLRYALYVRELHENDMWFSNIGVSGQIKHKWARF